MQIAGIEKSSFVDYPGRLCAVIFTPGCNFDCFFCHNRHIIQDLDDIKLFPSEGIIDILARRNKLLDAVCITGGEPFLQNDLMDFIGEIKQLNYLVKIDTNGYLPEQMNVALKSGMVDFIAMDIKAPLWKYSEICGVEVDTDKIKRSIDIILESGIQHEFRTTIIPQLTRDDVLELSEYVKGAASYALQQYRKPDDYKKADRFKVSVKPHDDAFIASIARELEGMYGKLIVRV